MIKNVALFFDAARDHADSLRDFGQPELARQFDAVLDILEGESHINSVLTRINPKEIAQKLTIPEKAVYLHTVKDTLFKMLKTTPQASTLDADTPC